MTVDELADALRDGGYRDDTYRIQRQAEDSTWCLKQQGNVWLVFYFEGGRRSYVRRFKDESSACEHFYGRVTHQRR